MTFLNLFSSQAAETPDAIAVADSSSALTYRELERRSSFLAAFLQGEGLKAGDAVGVLLPRTLDIVVAAIGIMKAGCVYMPIDPSYPEDRRAYMMENSGAKILLDESKIALALSCASEFREVSLAPDDPSYLLYTSGTTGRPKGVLHTHRSLLAMVLEECVCDYTSTGVMSGFTFIASIYMMLPPLVRGGRCTIIPEDVKTDLEALDRFIAEKGIREIFLPASLAATMAEEYPQSPSFPQGRNCAISRRKVPWR